jgi:hypothetical protein
MKHCLDIIHHKLIKLLDLIDSPLMLLGSYKLGLYKDFLGILGIAITVAYTIWKWRREWLETKLKK